MKGLAPIVLVGGRSTRFGRDKLREPVSEGWLVDRAIAALREATCERVTLVGACDPEIAARGDGALHDAHPGHGPAGGILTALEHFGADVLVLAGDLPCIRPENVRALIEAARTAPSALVVRARGDRPEPCVAIYRAPVASRLLERLRGGRRALIDVVDASELFEVSFRESDLANANTERDLREALGR